MKFIAHDYQQYATDFIIEHPVSCLILDMGLGKTVITLTALWLLLFDYFEVRRILVIAPKRVAETTWPAEIKKWEHLYGMTFAVAMGTAEQRKEALLSGADVTIIGSCILYNLGIVFLCHCSRIGNNRFIVILYDGRIVIGAIKNIFICLLHTICSIGSIITL